MTGWHVAAYVCGALGLLCFGICIGFHIGMLKADNDHLHALLERLGYAAGRARALSHEQAEKLKQRLRGMK